MKLKDVLDKVVDTTLWTEFEDFNYDLWNTLYKITYNAIIGGLGIKDTTKVIKKAWDTLTDKEKNLLLEFFNKEDIVYLVGTFINVFDTITAMLLLMLTNENAKAGALLARIILLIGHIENKDKNDGKSDIE